MLPDCVWEIIDHRQQSEARFHDSIFNGGGELELHSMHENPQLAMMTNGNPLLGWAEAPLGCGTQ